jgi:hydrogenase/urease accessory protein HupE
LSAGLLRRALAAVAVLSCVPQGASAHQLRLGYLQLEETAVERYAVLWKLPAVEGGRLALDVQLPSRCTPTSEPRADLAGDAFVQHWQLDCQDGLAGARIRVAGLSGSTADVLVRVSRLDGTTQSARLSASEPAFTVAAAPSLLQVVASYFVLGGEHILLGVDHLLFVLALMLIVTDVRRLVLTVTAFTIAHSITLSLATLDLLRVPIAPVEAIIALSIVFVAAEILRQQRGQHGLAQRAPWLVAFTFGLLHGLGFASALQEVGLPQVGIPLALLAFNVGVEGGQLLFVLAVLLVRWLLRQWLVQPPRWSRPLLPYALGSIAMTWVIQRVVAF